jgi:two-component system chemotaxis response regulator CheB
MIKVLVVDDSALMRRLLGGALKAEHDMVVEFARDGIEALARLHDFHPDVVTLDVQMPQMDGIACLDRIMVEHPCPVIMVSSLTQAGAETTVEALALGAVDFIAKPTGAISLAMDVFAPTLVDRVRSAARVRVRKSLRLAERIRMRAGGATRSSTAARISPSALEIAGATFERRSMPANAVVTVGSSTGGPPALDVLLSALPADFPWPILVAQHMPAAFTGALSRRLDKLCALRVTEVTKPTTISPGCVYIAQGDADIIVSSRPGEPVVQNAPPLPEHRWHPSVDRLVTTAIQHIGAERLIGILMTGMGNDGAAAMTRLSAEGGRTIAEAEETAVVWGMPGELVKAGGAQVVAPLHAISAQLLDWTA